MESEYQAPIVLYAVNKTGNGDHLTQILTDDGSIVEIHHNGENFVTTYFQDRCDATFDDDMWIKMADSKQYMKDWDESITEITDEMINDALEWLNVFAKEFREVDFQFLCNQITRQ
jgi:thiamine biosynthesis protein ThiC